MRLTWLAAVAMIPLVAGCTSSNGIALGGDDMPPEPYYKEYREDVSGSHLKLFEVPVGSPARLVNATVMLDARMHGLPVPGTTPAQLDVRLLDPDGAPLREVRLDPQHPEASLVLEDVMRAGTYLLEVRGVGASEEVDGSRYGAGYLASIEIVYA